MTSSLKIGGKHILARLLKNSPDYITPRRRALTLRKSLPFHPGASIIESTKIGTSHPKKRRNGLAKLENSIPRTTTMIKV